MVRLVEYSDSSDEDEEKLESSGDSGDGGEQEQEDWWRHHAGRKKNDDVGEQDSTTSSSFDDLSTNKTRPGSAKRVKSPSSPKSTTSSLPSYASSSSSSSAAGSPWSTPGESDSSASSNTMRDGHPQAAKAPFPTTGNDGFGSRVAFPTKPSSVFAGSFGDATSSAAVASGENGGASSAGAFVFGQFGTTAWPKTFQFGQKTMESETVREAPQEKTSKSNPEPTNEPFKTTFAHDAFKKMKTRLSFGGGGATSASEGDAVSEGATATTSVFGWNSAPNVHASNRPAFRPYDKGNATSTSARGSSARRRTHRDARRSQPASAAHVSGFPGLFANAAQNPQGSSQPPHTTFAPPSAAAPVDSYTNGVATAFTSSSQPSGFGISSSPKHLNGDDTRMDSPSSSSSDKKKTTAGFTFGKQQKKRITPFPAFRNRPSSTQADKRASIGNPVFATANGQHPLSSDDTVMREASAVGVTNIFKRQNSGSSIAFPTPGSDSKTKFGAPVPGETSETRPAFQFGNAVPSQGGWNAFTTASASTAPPSCPFGFGDKNKANAGPTASSFFFRQPEPTSSKGVVSSLRRRRRLNTATSVPKKESNGSSATRQSTANATNLFNFHQPSAPESGRGTAMASHGASHNPDGTTAAGVFRFGSQGATFPAKTPTAFVFGAPPKPDPAAAAASSAPNAETNVFTRDRAAAPAAFTNPNVGAGAQFPFGMATPTTPFVFGRPKSQEQQAQPAERRAGDFTFEPRAAGFTPSHRSSHKVDSHRKLRASFRAKATLGTPTPTGSAAAAKTSSATPGLSMESPFGLNTNASIRTNIFQQKRVNSEYSAPADPFATPVFQRATASEPPGASSTAQGKNAPASAKQKLDFTFMAGSRADASGSATPGHGAPVKEVYTFGAPSAASQQDKPKESPGFVFRASDWASTGQVDARNVSRNGKGTWKVHLRKQNRTSANAPLPVAARARASSDKQGGVQSGQSESVNTDVPSKFPYRRILRAARPSKRAQESPPTSSEDTDEFGDGDTAMVGDDRTRNDGTEWGELKRLGGLAYSRRSFREAAELYRRSVEAIELLLRNYPDLETEELMKDKAKLHSNRAASLMMLMQFPDALWECQQSIEVDPSYTRAYIRLCRIQVLYGDIVQAQQNASIAKQQLSELFFLNVDPADKASIEKMEQSIDKLSHFQVDIKRLMDIHEWAKALKSIDEALALAPYSRSLQAQKTQVLFKRKNYVAVVRFCNEVVEKHKKMSKAALGPKHTASSPNKSKAEQDVTIVGVDMGLHWASALHYQNKAEEAMVVVSALEHVAPCSSSVIQLKRKLITMKDLKHNANDAFKRNDFDRAVRIYAQALEVDPQHDEYCAVIYCNRAAAYMGMEQFNTAHLDCEEALRRKQQYPRALLRRARCFAALRKYQQALRDFDQYVREQRRDSAPTSAGPSLADIELERAQVKITMDVEREEKKRQAEARKRENARQRQRYAWEDSDFYEDFRSSYFKSTGSQSSGRSHAGYGGGTWHSEPPAAQPKVKQRTLYQVLGVHQRASADEVKKAYRKLALLHHPDKAKSDKDADLFKDMSAAYTVLSDAVARKKYDMELLYR